MLKVDIINDAYSQLRISGLTVVPSAEDVVIALNRLESMMSEWEESKNMCLGYVFEDNPDPNTDSGLQLYAKHAAATNLAVRLIPDFNKEVPNALIAQASQSYSTLSGKVINVRRTQYPNRMPRGSGSTRYNRWNRYFRSAEQAPISCSTQQLPINSIYEFNIDWSDFLQDNETIQSFSVDITNVAGAVTVLSKQSDGAVITIQVRSDRTGYVTLLNSIVTTNNRPNARQVNINVTEPVVI